MRVIYLGLKIFGDIPVNGKITLKYIYGRRMYRRESTVWTSFLLGGIVDSVAKAFCPFVPRLGGSQGTSRAIPHV